MRRDKERQRLAAAHAALNSSRPLVLAANPLIDDPTVLAAAKRRYPDHLLGEELALGDLMREAGQDVLAALGQDPRVARERAVLEAVLDGKSISAAAKQLGISREHLSNGAWRTVTGWLVEAFEEASASSRTPQVVKDPVVVVADEAWHR